MLWQRRSGAAHLSLPFRNNPLICTALLKPSLNESSGAYIIRLSHQADLMHPFCSQEDQGQGPSHCLFRSSGIFPLCFHCVPALPVSSLSLVSHSWLHFCFFGKILWNFYDFYFLSYIVVLPTNSPASFFCCCCGSHSSSLCKAFHLVYIKRALCSCSAVIGWCDHLVKWHYYESIYNWCKWVGVQSQLAWLSIQLDWWNWQC